MATRLTAACVQVNAGPEIAANLEAAGVLVRRARDAGAELIAMPENVSMVVQGRDKILARVRPETEHPGLPFFRALAEETGAWLLVGSLGIRLDGDQVANRSFLIDAGGTIVARYDKIHMFDVDLAGGESYRESRTFRPGERAVVAPSPWGGIGMTICYDLRFGYLHRALAQAGAAILTVPAAFTVPTGRAHWHVLLRARAIETGCFVIAPAQCGEHDEGRRTYGHSLIIDPWGEILADGGDDPGFVTAELDLDQVTKVRAMVPALQHDRPFKAP
ncbi:MAG: carbon-nitrogen hydrolase family protein [Azospirillum sp.]|nr:carbon-nitrogen hydrolase family protein [Azospirillum sp.]